MSSVSTIQDSISALAPPSVKPGQTFTIDPIAISNLGQSIANQIAQFLTKHMNPLTQHRPRDPWSVPPLPRDGNRYRTISPAPYLLSPGSQSPLAGESLWAPPGVRLPRDFTRKRKRAHRTTPSLAKGIRHSIESELRQAHNASIGVAQPYATGVYSDEATESASSSGSRDVSQTPGPDYADNSRFRTKKENKRWQPEEDVLLKRLRDVNKMSWQQIVPRLPGRTAGSLMARYRRYLEHIPVPKRGTFQREIVELDDEDEEEYLAGASNRSFIYDAQSPAPNHPSPFPANRPNPASAHPGQYSSGFPGETVYLNGAPGGYQSFPGYLGQPPWGASQQAAYVSPYQEQKADHTESAQEAPSRQPHVSRQRFDSRLPPWERPKMRMFEGANEQEDEEEGEDELAPRKRGKKAKKKQPEVVRPRYTQFDSTQGDGSFGLLRTDDRQMHPPQPLQEEMLGPLTERSGAFGVLRIGKDSKRAQIETRKAERAAAKAEKAQQKALKAQERAQRAQQKAREAQEAKASKKNKSTAQIRDGAGQPIFIFDSRFETSNPEVTVDDSGSHNARSKVAAHGNHGTPESMFEGLPETALQEASTSGSNTTPQDIWTPEDGMMDFDLDPGTATMDMSAFPQPPFMHGDTGPADVGLHCGPMSFDGATETHESYDPSESLFVPQSEPPATPPAISPLPQLSFTPIPIGPLRDMTAPNAARMHPRAPSNPATPELDTERVRKPSRTPSIPRHILRAGSEAPSLRSSVMRKSLKTPTSRHQTPISHARSVPGRVVVFQEASDSEDELA